MNHNNRQTDHEPKEENMSLEAIISAGVFGWLAIGMVLMGLGIW
jgi:hypothetical protein